MGTVFIIVFSPRFDLLPGIYQREEPCGIQTFLTKAAVECLDKRIVGGLSRPGEVEVHPVPAGPLVQDAANELRTIVAPN
jgi:hypothetical protein